MKNGAGGGGVGREGVMLGYENLFEKIAEVLKKKSKKTYEDAASVDNLIVRAMDTHRTIHLGRSSFIITLVNHLVLQLPSGIA